MIPAVIAGQFSGTFEWIDEGGTSTPDGTEGFTTKQWAIQEVPAGKRVRLLRIYGNWTAWPLGVVPAGTYAGILFSVTASSYGQSPFVGTGLGATNNSLFLQSAVNQEPVAVPFDLDISAAGLLEPDNIMMHTLAIFWNQTGLQVQQEVQFVVEFGYE